MSPKPSLLQRYQPHLLVLVFLALFLGALGIERAALRKEAVFGAKERARNLTEILQQNIEVGGPLWRLLADLDDPRSYTYLNELVQHDLRELGLAKVKFYDLEGRIVYAEDPTLRGQDHSHKEPFLRARSGEEVSVLVAPKAYRDAYGAEITSSLVETYLPVYGRGGEITQVMEAYQDFDPVLARVRAQTLRTALLLGMMLIAALGAVLLLQRRIRTLASEVETLESFLPICAYCKKIRVESENEPDQWVAVDHYMMEREIAEFSHGICDDCVQKHFPEDA